MNSRLIRLSGLALVVGFIILVKRQGQIPDRVRYFNKRVLNRLVLRIAGLPGSPLAIVQHTGRRSSKVYQTPVIVGKEPGGFVFALTYGDHVDWYRNILASGECTLSWQGQEFKLENPETIDAVAGVSAFGPPFQQMLTFIGIRDFFHMKQSAKPFS
jgi:deazaflavin-dependent oxidoreductase (nitroreductase family)